MGRSNMYTEANKFVQNFTSKLALEQNRLKDLIVEGI